MSSWRFVGRTGELARLVSAAETGGRGIFFSGTAGVGKSRLLREGSAALPPERFALWSASATLATSGLPFGGLAQVLPADQPPNLPAAGVLRWALDTLHRQAAGRRIVLAVDDAHLLDASSAALVHLIARSDNATVIGAWLEGSQLPLPVRALWTDDLADLVDIGPLGLDDTAELIAGLVGGPVAPASAQRLWRLAGGNPLLVRELIEAARRGGELSEAYGQWQWSGRLAIAPTLADLIDARIGQLDPGLRIVAEYVAFGEPLGLDLLIRATTAAEVEQAEELGLVSVTRHEPEPTVRLAQPLYGEIVRQQCPVSRARRLKTQLADLLAQSAERRGDDLLRVAVWRLDCGDSPSPRLLLTAAQEASVRYDVPLATRLARAAVAAGGGFDARELLAALLTFNGQSDEALALLDDRADSDGSELRRARRLTMRALVTYWGQCRTDGVEELAEQGATFGDPGARGLVRSFEAAMRLHQLDVAAARRLCDEVLAQPALPTAAQTFAHCTLGYLHAVKGELLTSEKVLAAVRDDSDRWRAQMPYLQLALEVADGTRLALGADLAGLDAIVADEFADLFAAGDFHLAGGFLSVLRAYAARLRGRSADALRTSLGACALLTTSRIFASLAHAERAQAAALRGELSCAREAMAESDRVHTPAVEMVYPWREQARAAVAAGGGDLTGALRHLGALVLRLQNDGLAGHEVRALHDLVRLDRPRTLVGVAAHGGTRPTAAQRLAELAEVVEGPLPPVLAWHARALTTGSGSELLAVAGTFEEMGLHLYAAEAAAQAVRRLRDNRHSSLAAQRRLTALLARCDVVRTPALAGSRPVLTARESEIARLAATGTPSRGIAARLYLSARTVDNHLQRIYRKLGVAGRPELPAALAAMPDHVHGGGG